MKSLRLLLFGKPQILLDGESLTGQLPAKAQAALIYLAISQRPTTRTYLAGLLWSDMPEDAARASLRVVLSKLRPHLQNHLVINRREVGFDPTADVWVDVLAFGSAADCTLYTAPFLNDFPVRDASLFEQWASQQRQRLHQQAVGRLEQTARQSRSVDDWRKLLTLEPWREEAHRELMHLLAQAGQRGEALAQFEQCQQSLKAALDAEPAAETLALVEQIKAGGMAVSAPQNRSKTASGPSNLTPSATSFVGRAAELTQIESHLTNDDCRLLTLTGVGGIGKTRLALETGDRLLPSFKDGVFQAQLVSLVSADLIPTTVAQALGIPLQGQQKPRVQLLNVLQNKHLLLILDNFEHLLDGIDLLLDLLDQAPNLKILVTSREPLGIRDEWVFPLTGLPYEPQSEQIAGQLFSARAKRFDLSFDTAKESAEIDHICQLVEGMPLAIELASAWVRVISCREIGAEIQQNLDFLATDLGIVPDHQTSMRAVFLYSWRLLPDEAQRGLAKLAIFRGTMTRISAESVAGVSLRTLTTLVDKSLLQKEADGRFRIHPLIRQFALEQLGPADLDRANVSYASYFAELLSSREGEMYTRHDPDLLDFVQAEIENVRAVWDWLIGEKQHQPLAEKLFLVTGYYFQRRNLYFDGVGLFGRIANDRDGWNEEVWGKGLVHTAIFEYLLGRLDQAESHLNTAIPILQQADEATHTAEGYCFLGLVATRRGDYDRASAHFADSRSLFEAMDDQKGVARVSNGLGISNAMRGRYAEAEANYLATLEIQRSDGYLRGVGNALSNIGSVYGRSKAYEKSLDHYLQAKEMLEKAGDKLGDAVVLSNLGSVYRELNRFEESVQNYKLSLPMTQEMGERRWVAANFNGLGQTYLRLGQLELAAESLRAGLETSLEINAIPDALTALSHLGRVFVATPADGRVELGGKVLTFVATHAVTPDLTRQEAEKVLAELTGQLSAAEKDSIVNEVQAWSFAEATDAIKNVFGD